MQTLNYTDTLAVLSCASCFVKFALPESLRHERQEAGGNFYCPNGHTNVYRDTDVMRLEREKKQLADKAARLTAEVDQQRAWRADERKSHEQTQKRLNATKGVVTRYKRRITAGACVCCSRKFKDLERHMKAAHPDFDPDKHIEAMVAKS